jgi:hypothetical protein
VQAALKWLRPNLAFAGLKLERAEAAMCKDISIYIIQKLYTWLPRTSSFIRTTSKAACIPLAVVRWLWGAVFRLCGGSSISHSGKSNWIKRIISYFFTQT